MKISVVVPIYNVENYLSICIESLLNQRFSDYEIILVNDGSTDKSGEIAKSYADKYEQIRMVTIENSGLSEARNVGLKYANGIYVAFVDSDDYVEDTYLRDLYDVVNLRKLDIAICSFYRLSNNKKVLEDIKLDSQKVYSNIEILRNVLMGKVQCYAWNKIYKRSLFTDNNIKYPPGKLYEDIETFVRLVINSKKIGFLKKGLYNYRIRNGSIVNKEKNKKAILDMNYAIEKVNKVICENELEKKVEDELVSFNIMYTLSSLDMLGQNIGYKLRSFYSEFKELSCDKFFNYSIISVLKNKKIDSWKKRDYILFKLGILTLKNKIRDRKRL